MVGHLALMEEISNINGTLLRRVEWKRPRDTGITG